MALQRVHRGRTARQGSRLVLRGRPVRELVDLRHDAGDRRCPTRRRNDNKRYEGKVTGTLRQGHTLQGRFVDNRVHRENEPVLSFSIDKAALISPSMPNRLGVVNYNAALHQRMLLSAQYSQKDWSTEGVGGTSTDIIDSPFLTRTGTQYQYNAPYFDASDPEQRNNRQLTASLTLFRVRAAASAATN